MIVGRGATFILPAETTLRVRLVAPVADRIEMLRHRLGLSQRQAAQRVRTIERQRNDFVRDHFQRDPTEPDNFDLMLNASRFSIEEAAETIVEVLRRLKQHTPASHEPADAAR